jgi:hypothetical protein
LPRSNSWHFGTLGVFKLKNLQTAQGKGIALIWERDLTPLGAFIEAVV